MEKKRKRKKGPCRVCRKWFTPEPRLGDRQQTCGAMECQRKWHARKCAEWNWKNPAYFKEIYIRAPPLIKIDPFVLMRHDPEDAQLIGWRS